MAKVDSVEEMFDMILNRDLPLENRLKIFEKIVRIYDTYTYDEIEEFLSIFRKFILSLKMDFDEENFSKKEFKQVKTMLFDYWKKYKDKYKNSGEHHKHVMNGGIFEAFGILKLKETLPILKEYSELEGPECRTRLGYDFELDPYYYTRKAAVKALSNFSENKVLSFLENRLGKRLSSSIGFEILNSIGKIGSNEAIEILYEVKYGIIYTYSEYYDDGYDLVSKAENVIKKLELKSENLPVLLRSIMQNRVPGDIGDAFYQYEEEQEIEYLVEVINDKTKITLNDLPFLLKVIEKEADKATQQFAIAAILSLGSEVSEKIPELKQHAAAIQDEELKKLYEKMLEELSKE